MEHFNNLEVSAMFLRTKVFCLGNPRNSLAQDRALLLGVAVEMATVEIPYMECHVTDVDIIVFEPRFLIAIIWEIKNMLLKSSIYSKNFLT